MKLDATDIEDLRPVICAVVAEILEKTTPVDSRIKDRLAIPEREAAELLGVPQHVLRDARYRGELKGKRLGKKVVYSPDELRRFLQSLDDA